MTPKLFPQVINSLVTTGSALTATTASGIIDFRNATGFLVIKVKASAYASAGDFTLTLYGDFSLTSGALTSSIKIKDLQTLSGSDFDVHVLSLTMADGLLPYMRVDAVYNSGTSVTLSQCDAFFQLWM